MTTLAFCDTETTSLRPDRRAWEIGLIVREPGKPDIDHRWFIRAEDLDLGNADPMALKVGRFYERHPDFLPGSITPEGDRSHPEEYVLRKVERWTRGAHLVGAVVNFDADVLGPRMRARGILPAWNYRLIDVRPLAAGYLMGHAAMLEREGAPAERVAALRGIAAPPWNPDELARAVGAEPDENARHTALGDAAQARDVYDAVMGGAR